MFRAFEGSISREQGNITSVSPSNIEFGESLDLVFEAALELCQSLFENNLTFEKICEKVIKSF